MSNHAERAKHKRTISHEGLRRMAERNAAIEFKEPVYRENLTPWQRVLLDIKQLFCLHQYRTVQEYMHTQPIKQKVISRSGINKTDWRKMDYDKRREVLKKYITDNDEEIEMYIPRSFNALPDIAKEKLTTGPSHHAPHATVYHMYMECVKCGKLNVRTWIGPYQAAAGKKIVEGGKAVVPVTEAPPTEET